mgnify:CR=1 FL=1
MASRLFLLSLAELANNCLTIDTGVSYVEAVMYGIKWAHSMAGLVSCPVSHPLVKPPLEGAKRKLARLIRPEEPLSVGIVQAIVNFYSLDVSLAVPHFLFIFFVGFYGFFRIDKIYSFRIRDIIV